MKKSVVLFSLFLIILTSFVIAQTNSSTNSTQNSTQEFSKVDKAYQCLNNKIDCSKLSLEEQTFSLLSVGKCKDEVEKASVNNECWSLTGATGNSNSCSIRATAQAILALKSKGASTSKAEKWLISQNVTSTDVDWLLQIDAVKETTCTITSKSGSNQVSIKSDKTLSGGAGNCLSLSEEGYWLRVSPGCYQDEFEILCQEPFVTNLLYKKKTSSTIYVSEETHSASSGGTTKEKINSFCFKNPSSGACDYEGSLWAAFVLDNLNHDVSGFIPYLVTNVEEAPRFLPESFLYLITGNNDFRASLLLKQKNNFWEESGDRFYDTALALLPFQFEAPNEKTKSKNWLLNAQDSDGCWNGNIRNTAFILYSIWPKNTFVEDGINGGSGSGGGKLDCESSGYYCMSAFNCGSGQILNEYSCVGEVLKCCNKPLVLDTCQNIGGKICNSNQKCIGGTTQNSAGLNIGESCCVKGSCQEPTETSQCQSSGGNCRISGCLTGEKENSLFCPLGDICCVKSSDPSSGKSKTWIWVISILIVLILIGILFRNKLRELLFRIKTRKGSESSGQNNSITPRRGFPPSTSVQRPTPRMIIPSSQGAMRRPISGRKPESSKELDDVLKKLKEMGK